MLSSEGSPRRFTGISRRTPSSGSIAEKLGRDAYLAVVDHWNQARYPGQRVFVVDVDGYAHYVPFVESPEKIFLKTIFPSRKATRLYLRTQ